MNKFTKGPWSFKQQSYLNYIGSIEPSGIWFGGRSSIDEEEHLANVALVVAAPDLLKALDSWLNAYDDADSWMKCREDAKIAYEKATGIKWLPRGNR